MNKFFLLALFSLPAYAGGFPDKSSIGTPEMAKCAASALKFDRKTWGTWHDALHDRYKIIYKNKMSEKQIADYTIERVQDKKRDLMKSGIDSRQAYKNYWDINCKGQI